MFLTSLLFIFNKSGFIFFSSRAIDSIRLSKSGSHGPVLIRINYILLLQFPKLIHLPHSCYIIFPGITGNSQPHNYRGGFLPMETLISLVNYAISLQIPWSCKARLKQRSKPFVFSSPKLSDLNFLYFLTQSI